MRQIEVSIGSRAMPAHTVELDEQSALDVRPVAAVPGLRDHERALERRQAVRSFDVGDVAVFEHRLHPAGVVDQIDNQRTVAMSDAGCEACGQARRCRSAFLQCAGNERARIGVVDGGAAIEDGVLQRGAWRVEVAQHPARCASPNEPGPVTPARLRVPGHQDLNG